MNRKCEPTERGYTEKIDDAKRRMKHDEVQRQCPKCGKWHIWEKSTAKEPTNG